MKLKNTMLIKDKKGSEYLIKSAKDVDAFRIEMFLKSLSKESKDLFHPHPFDVIVIKKLLGFKSDVRLLLITKKNKNMVGYAFASKIPGTKIGYFGIVIGDKFQGQGLGGSFTDYLLNYSGSIGLKEILLNVYKINRNAIKVYKKIGFKIVKVNFPLRFLVTISEIIKNFGVAQLLRIIGKSINKKEESVKVSVWMSKKL